MLRSRVQQAGAAVLLVWCVVAAASGLRAALARGGDDRARLEAALHALAEDIPSRAKVGYVDPGEHDGMAIHAVQYALVPRIVVQGAGPEYLIVAGDLPASADPSLAHYEPVGGPIEEHRLYRRTR